MEFTHLISPKIWEFLKICTPLFKSLHMGLFTEYFLELPSKPFCYRNSQAVLITPVNFTGPFLSRKAEIFCLSLQQC